MDGCTNRLTLMRSIPRAGAAGLSFRGHDARGTSHARRRPLGSDEAARASCVDFDFQKAPTPGQ